MVEKIIDSSILLDNLKLEDITFILTENCNFSCKYCPLIKRNFFLNYKYIEEILIEFIDYLISNVSIVYVTFFGGEPLLNTNFVYDFINFLKNFFLKREDDSKFIIKICTNLYNYNDTLFSFLKAVKLEFKNKIFFQIDISLDLINDFHDKNRLTKWGKESYFNVLSNYTRLYDEYGELFYIGLNSVLGVDVVSGQDIEYILDKIKNSLYKFKYDFFLLMPEMLTSKKIENLKLDWDNLLKDYNKFLLNFSKLILSDTNLRNKVSNFDIEQDITLPPIGPTISPDYKIYLTRDYIFSMDYKNRIKPFGNLTMKNLIKSLKFINNIGIKRLSYFYLRQYLGDTYYYNKQIIDIFNQYFGSSL